MSETTTPGIAVVTGAAGGMGEFIVRRLHAAGHRVILADIADEKTAQIAADLSPDGSTAYALHLDVSQRKNFVTALNEIKDRWGTPTILVNNAAVTKSADLMTIGDEEFDKILSINVNSIFFGCQVIGAAMAEAGFGRIINMASLAGQNGGTATGAHYAASKGAILTVTKIFAKQFAGNKVTVNALSPGPHDLPIVHQTVPADKLDGVIASIPVQALGSATFIAKTVELLADDDAHFVTGACWDINGGLYVR